MRCRSSVRRAAGSSPRTRMSTSRRSSRTLTWASGIWFSMRRGRTRSASSNYTARWCCRNCASASDNMTARLELFAVPGLPMVRAGDNLPALIVRGLDKSGERLKHRDVVVVAQKIVSKAEGRSVDLADVEPSAEAVTLAAEVGKDPRIVQVVLSESAKVVRSRPNLMIMQHRLGFVMANAGVDQSNVAESDGRLRALLLPLDPDGSARAIRAALARHADV